MNLPETTEVVVEKRKPGRPKGSGPKVTGGTADARQIGAAILEVMAGARSPLDAAEALSVSLQRYYQLERRALEGLVSACEPRRKGRQKKKEDEVPYLKERIAELEKDILRQQALIRASQRTVGLAEASREKFAPGRKRKKRRASVRALKVIQVLRSSPEPEDVPIPEVPEGAP